MPWRCDKGRDLYGALRKGWRIRKNEEEDSPGRGTKVPGEHAIDN